MSASSTFIPSRSVARSPVSRPSLETSPSYSSYMTGYMPGQLTQRAFWFYFLLALVGYVVLFFTIRERNQNVHAWARVPCWLGNPFVLTVIVLLVLGLAAYATAVAHGQASSMNWALTVGGTYTLILILVVVIAWLTYRSHSFVASFYLAIVAVVLSLIHFVLVWSTSKTVALLTVPLVLFLMTVLYYLWFMADESTDCNNSCGPVYEVVMCAPTV
jgi:tryptophan-rich sensory protein